MPSRRAYLAGVGGLLATTGGCLSVGGGDADPTPTEEPTGTPTDPPSGTVAVDDVVVKKAAGYESTMGSGGVLAAEEKQYVVGIVSAETEVSPSDFSFEAGGDAWDPGLPDTAGGVNRSVAGREGRPLGYGAYEPDSDAYLAFVVPSPLSASDPKVAFSGEEPGEWSLDADSRERLAAPEPRFELESLSAPDEVTEGNSLDVSLEVRNVSETDGRFLAACYWPTRLVADDDESTVVERTIAAGGVETVPVGISTKYTEDEDATVELEVEGHVTASREVEFRTR